MNNKQKKAFTLIETIIATTILTIAVFWVYKLIWENTKLINNSSNYNQSVWLFSTITECLENTWYSIFSNKKTWYSTWIYLWNTLTWCYFSNSWNIINNLEYYLNANITNTWSDFIEWNIKIESDWIKTFTWKYIQIKK